MNSQTVKLAIVCPCYNEEAVLPTSIPRLVALVANLTSNYNCSEESFIVLVDDGSRDHTWDLIAGASASYPKLIRGIRLCRNVGHQYALMAGLSYVTGKCDAAISIDVDLQDDLEAIPKMIDEYKSGAQIVLGVKESRTPDDFFKKLSATLFYKIMHLLGVDLVRNHADCRLMSNTALKNLSEYPEAVLFLRGLQPHLHRKITTVSYHIAERQAGNSKYTLSKMLSLAINGITSFSIVPLRIISVSGFSIFVASLPFAFIALEKALTGQSIPGWASITVPLYLLGGMSMLSIGIVGEYVGKIYLEVKRRPRYLVDQVVE